MELHWKETRKFITEYLIGYGVVCLVVFIGMKWYKERNFSPAKLETMMANVSTKRDITDDPCKYAIFGEPSTARLEYVKVYIFCSKVSKSLNSMDMRAIKNKTVGGAIKELGRVNGFKVTVENNMVVLGDKKDLQNDDWVCLQNRKRVQNYNDPLIQRATIDCFNGLTDKEIISFYETI